MPAIGVDQEPVAAHHAVLVGDRQREVVAHPLVQAQPRRPAQRAGEVDPLLLQGFGHASTSMIAALTIAPASGGAEVTATPVDLAALVGQTVGSAKIVPEPGDPAPMPDWMSLAILIGAGLVAVSIFTSVLASRLGAPLLLLFLGLGLLVGEDGLGLRFDNAPLAYLVGSVALAVILFDSGFATRIRTLRSVAGPALALATVGVLLTTSITAVAAHLLFGFDWIQALLMGAIVSPTDAAAVFFLMRVGGITVRDRVRATLEIESGTNDPMAIFLTATLVAVLAGEGAGASLGWSLAELFALQLGSARHSVPSGVWRSSRRSIASSSSPGFTRWWCWAWRCCCSPPPTWPAAAVSLRSIWRDCSPAMPSCGRRRPCGASSRA